MQAESGTATISPPNLAEQVQALFSPYANPSAASLMRVIAAIPRHFATPNPNDGVLWVDKRAVLTAMIEVGAAQAREEPQISSALWAYQWLARRGKILVGLGPSSDPARFGTLPPQLSSSLRSAIGYAEELAARTVQRKNFDMRHLLFALLDKPADEWDGLVAPPLTPQDFDALRDHVARQLIERPEPGENLEPWQAFVRAEPAPAPAPAPAEPRPRAKRQSRKPAPMQAEALRTQRDQPASEDALNRRFFATALADRLRSAHAENVASPDPGAFMAHIHGPWGYGKSSTLNFLRKELEAPAERKPGETPRPGDGPWLVVDFNAWKNHRIRPPWWSLISALYDAARKSPEIRANWQLWRIWWGWRLRADWGPIALVVALIAIGAAGIFTSADSTLKLVSGLITAGAAIFAGTRVLSFGSAKAAQAYAELKTDPYRPVVRLYCQLIEAIGRPVAIFVDDLDRCEGSYVVELVEGIQTLLRAEPVTYVIAADRKWICSAFEKKYTDFSGSIGEPARPLGYLFLDKLFQISAALPGLSADIRKGYWSTLLDDGAGAEKPAEMAPAEAAAVVEGKGSMEALNAVIAAAPQAHRPALRAAAAVEITRAHNSERLEHSLQPFADLLEPNPRAMKRLVNAVGMAQARALLEGRAVSLDTLTRWTLIELRWPLLADYLTDNLEAIEAARRDPTDQDIWPGTLAPLSCDRHVRAIVAPKSGTGLDAALLAGLLA